MATTDVLVRLLLQKPVSHERDRIITYASQGMYHDFRSQLPCPKMTLVEHLREAGFEDLALDTMSGKFDE